ncbi:MAG TPA: FAD-dependent oxidoreductase, partial [Alicycliphilus sp.]|nr:FAD-dependent oxidoreductase [Alicycliphilus sp.]
MTESTQHQVVIVGGGVAGLEIASALGRRWRGGKPAGKPTVTLVDCDSAHVWKPMLHTIAAGTRDVSQQQTTYIGQAKEAGFTFQPGAFSGLSRDLRQVTLAPLHAADGRLLIPERQLPYDTLVLALGSQANDFGTPGVAEHAWKIDSRVQ